MPQQSETSAIIAATPNALFDAFTDPNALETWQAPGDMTGKVHAFDARPGGGYEMSLYYPSSIPDAHGKFADHEDRFTTRFLKLDSPNRIVQVVTFDSSDPAFAGEMTMTITFRAAPDGTIVTIHYDNIPRGIDPADNDTGTRLSLQKLAEYVASRSESDTSNG